MLRLSKMADYGMVVLAHAAREPLGIIHSTRTLATQSRLPEPTVGKVVKALTRAGILFGHRGARGGYSLARSTELITVAQVVEALDGPVAVTACLGDHQHCALLPDCLARPGWSRLNAVMTQALEKTTLADMGMGPMAPRPYDTATRARGNT